MRRITAAIIVSALGTWSYNVAIAVYAYQVTGSTAWVAAATVGRYVPALFIASLGSRWSSRFPRRTVAVVSDVVCALAMVLLTVVASSGGSLVVAIALAAVSSGLARVQSSAALSLAADVVVESELVRRMAFIGTSEAVATAAGPALASAVLLVASPAWLFLLNAITFLVSALLLLGVRDRRRRTSGGSAPVASPGARATVLATVRPLLVLRTIAAAVYGADIVLLAVIATDSIRSGTSGYGWLLAAAGVGGLLIAVVMRRREGSGRVTVPATVGMALYTLPLLAFTVIAGLLPSLLAQTVRGVGCVLVVTLVLTALQRGVPSELSQEVFGQTHSLVLVGTVIGSLLAPVLLSTVGLDATLVLLAVVPVLATLALLPGLRRFDGTTDLTAAMLDPVVHTLRGLTLFQDASRWTLIEVADRVEPFGVRAGDVLVQQGEPADALYVLVEGEVDVTTYGPDGPVRLRTMTSPSYFGEIGLIQGVPRTATVTASTAATLWRIPAEAFLDAAGQAGISGALSDSVRIRLRNTPGEAPALEV
jgi:MFS family permease